MLLTQVPVESLMHRLRLVLFCWSVSVPVPLRLPPRIRSSAVSVIFPPAPVAIAPVFEIVLPAPVTVTLTVFPAAVVIAGSVSELVLVSVTFPTAVLPPHAPFKVIVPAVTVRSYGLFTLPVNAAVPEPALMSMEELVPVPVMKPKEILPPPEDKVSPLLAEAVIPGSVMEPPLVVMVRPVFKK